MGTFTAQWEDEDNNRVVDLAVRYQLDSAEILSVTPAAITFVDELSREATRRIAIHTEKGRRMLRRQFMRSVGLDWLQSEVNAGVLV